MRKKGVKAAKPPKETRARARRETRRRKARPPETPFQLWRAALAEAEEARLSAYLAELASHIGLPKVPTAAMQADFEAAILYLCRAGVPLAEVLERLDTRNLGGFYIRPPVLWYALDDAAKVYPLSMKHGQMAVFRLAARLTEPVVPELLQIALTFSIKRFPSFATTVKKGLFWHYLDTARRRYAVEPETEVPCRPLNLSQSGSQSFRVLYYGDRVSVEYFHGLTDGSGGMVFLKTLLRTYFRLLGVAVPEGWDIPDINAAPSTAETDSAFPPHPPTRKASGFLGKAALQMSGKVSHWKPCRVLHFNMDARRLRDAAKARGVTVTAYTLALLFLANRYATEETSGDINIQVPVNMRKFYPSETLRNFALYCSVRLPIETITDVDAILPEISRQLREKGSKEAMDEMLSSTARLVSSVRCVPLFIKAPIAGVVYNILADKIFSNTLSNLGVVKLPPELQAHIRNLEFLLGTILTNRAGCSMVTLGSVATLTVAKLTADPSFEEKLYELLGQEGIPVRVEGSELYAD